ncbi:MAG: TolC family protein, partial [Candidatus Eremiobacteraeota bacterium]|nr:TolC family protein [Candidatus Eremiobacteraeota bacterium]
LGFGTPTPSQAAGAKAAVAAATPTPIPQREPAALPYPAFGTPAPGMAQTQAPEGVPSEVTLSQAIAIAAAKSPVLQAARDDYQIAKAPVDLAKSAIYPNVSGAATLSHSVGGGRSSSGSSGSGGTSGGSFGDSFTSKGLNLSVRQLIFDGGKVLAQIHQARANLVAAADTYDRNVQTLAFNVSQQYYTALQAERATALAARVVQQNQVQENLVRAQIRAGTVPRSDLATAELPTAQARVALVRAQGQELSALATFANTLGLDADAGVRPANDARSDAATMLLSNPPLSYSVAVARALALRPDFLASQHLVDAAQANVRVAKLGRAPNLSGNFGTGYNSTLPNGSGMKASSTVGATLNIPIFDQGIAAAQTEQAQALLDKAYATVTSTRLGVELAVRQGLVNLVSANAAVTQADVELAKARQVLQATQAQYRAGVTTLPLLLNAQVGLTQAETDRLNAVYALRQAEQSYVFAIGESGLGAP